MNKRGITVYDLQKFFKFKQVAGNNESLGRPIFVQQVNRPGLELGGFYDYSELKRLVLIGNKETAFIAKLDKETRKERFKFLINPETPAIVISGGNPCPPELLELAKQANFPIFLTSKATSDINVALTLYLNELLAPNISVHATLLEVYGVGVLLTGESGIGKSEIALELIRKGHRLIADDRVEITKINNELVGSCPELTQGIMEVRGIGIIDVTRVFGINAFKEKEAINVHIDLVKFSSEHDFERLGNSEQFKELLGIQVPYNKIPVSDGRNMADIIEVAINNFLLKQKGFDAAKEFNDKLNKLLQGGRS